MYTWITPHIVEIERNTPFPNILCLNLKTMERRWKKEVITSDLSQWKPFYIFNGGLHLSSDDGFITTFSLCPDLPTILAEYELYLLLESDSIPSNEFMCPQAT